jgi:hypothetical protein
MMHIHVKITKSKKKDKKFTVCFENGTEIHFGANGYSDYTIHKDPKRMRNYLIRHGGLLTNNMKRITDSVSIHKAMLEVIESDKEVWDLNGLHTAGFWSRWFLWSFPTTREVQKFMKQKFKLNIKMINYRI